MNFVTKLEFKTKKISISTMKTKKISKRCIKKVKKRSKETLTAKNTIAECVIVKNLVRNSFSYLDVRIISAEIAS
jgi:hypothetical protein